MTLMAIPRISTPLSSGEPSLQARPKIFWCLENNAGSEFLAISLSVLDFSGLDSLALLALAYGLEFLFFRITSCWEGCLESRCGKDRRSAQISHSFTQNCCEAIQNQASASIANPSTEQNCYNRVEQAWTSTRFSRWGADWSQNQNADFFAMHSCHFSAFADIPLRRRAHASVMRTHGSEGAGRRTGAETFPLKK